MKSWANDLCKAKTAVTNGTFTSFLSWESKMRLSMANGISPYFGRWPSRKRSVKMSTLLLWLLSELFTGKTEDLGFHCHQTVISHNN